LSWERQCKLVLDELDAEHAAQAAAKQAAEQAKQIESPDEWIEILRNVKGRIDDDNVERISSLFLFEYLDVKPHERLSQSQRLKQAMCNALGWQQTRVFHLNERSWREQIRGYARLVETNNQLRGYCHEPLGHA
jgi:hypothetical protein